MPNNKQGWLKKFFSKNRITQAEYAQIADEDTPPPKLNIIFTDSNRLIYAGLLIIFIFFGIGGAWITFAKISGAVIATGEIRVDAKTKTVQHLEGGIVRDILVKDGDVVELGQPLILLDSSRVVSATEQVYLQLAAAKLADLRLQAEKDFADSVAWPKSFPGVDNDRFVELLDSAKKIFSSGRLALDNQIALLNKQIDQLHQQDISISSRIKAQEDVVITLQEELDAKMVLYEEKYIDKINILELRRSIAQYRGTNAQLEGSQAEIREKIAEYELRIHAAKNEFLQNAINKQSEVQQQLFDLQQRLLPLEDAKNRLTIVAPVSGVVVGLSIHSRGGVVSPGQPLLDIVPKNSELIVVCNIQVQDIDHVYLGQPADVQLLAFSNRTTPKILGNIVYISADRVLQKTPYGDQPSYEVHLVMDKTQLEENNLNLTAGMSAVVYILTKEKTLLDYIIEPMKTNFDQALRED
jgi:HlyD family type I secretion membrane fusion protein